MQRECKNVTQNVNFFLSTQYSEHEHTHTHIWSTHVYGHTHNPTYMTTHKYTYIVMHTDIQTDAPQGFAKHWVLQASLLLKFYPGLGPEASLLRVKFCFCLFVSLVKYLSALYFSFLICKMAIIICLFHRLAMRSKLLHIWCLKMCLVHIGSS